VLSPVRKVLLVDEAVSRGTTFRRAGTLAHITATIHNSFCGSPSMPESISTKRLWIMGGLMTIP
jgi:hypothetical protein